MPEWLNERFVEGLGEGKRGSGWWGKEVEGRKKREKSGLWMGVMRRRLS